MFNDDICCFVPQLAMSGGTMIALSCREIWMGHYSCLGPFDPQYDGKPAHAVVEEFRKAKREITESPANIPLWQPILANYTPSLVVECQKVSKWAQEMVERSLREVMFKDVQPASQQNKKIRAIIRSLGSHAETKSHSRHIPQDELLKTTDLNIKSLESDKILQDAVLAVHHACILTLQQTGAFKIVENHKGIGYITHLGPPPPLK